MVIQNFLFPDEVCDVQEVYFRTTGMVDRIRDSIKLSAGEVLRTDTYMNVLNIGHWKKYTVLEEILLELQVQGHFRLYIELLGKEKRKELIYEQEYHLESPDDF